MLSILSFITTLSSVGVVAVKANDSFINDEKYRKPNRHFSGDSMPLPSEQDVLAAVVSSARSQGPSQWGGHGGGEPALAAPPPPCPSRPRRRPRASPRPRHVLHAGLQRQPDLAAHTIT